MELAGILISVVLLFVLAYIGAPVLVIGPFCALIVIVTNQMPLMETLQSVFLGSLGSTFGLLFLLGLFGALMAEFYKSCGGASSIARGLMGVSKKVFKSNNSVAVPITVVTLIGMVLCYGGVNGVIVVIVLYPLAMEIMREYDIPRYMAPGILLGATCTAAMTMPGSPQQQNTIPQMLLGTSSTAGLIPGIIGGVVVVVLCIWMMSALAKRAMKRGDGFEMPQEMAEAMQAAQKAQADGAKQRKLPNPWISAIPLVLTFVLYVIVGMNIVIALAAGFILCIVCFAPQWKNWKTLCDILTHGSMDNMGLFVVVCVLSGFGAVVAGTDAFRELCEAVIAIPLPALFKVLISMAITVCIAGSGPAGLSAGIPMFQSTFEALGVNMAAVHRIAAFTGTCLDTLPSNAAVSISAKLSGYPVKRIYKYCFLTTVLATSIGAVVVTVLLMLFPGWA